MLRQALIQRDWYPCIFLEGGGGRWGEGGDGGGAEGEMVEMCHRNAMGGVKGKPKRVTLGKRTAPTYIFIFLFRRWEDRFSV